MNRKAFAILLLAAQCAAFPAGAEPKGSAPVPAKIDKNGLLTLLRSTILAVQHGDETGNYTVLRDLSAPAFRQANTAARLAEIFANLRNRKLDLSGVAVLEPQLTVLPQIENNGMMRVAGVFPSAPMQINFEILYAPVDGRWRPFGISVGVGSSNPTPPGTTTRPPAPDIADVSSSRPAKPRKPAQVGSPTRPKPRAATPKPAPKTTAINSPRPVPPGAPTAPGGLY